MTAIYVALGGALGSVLRYGAGVLASKALPGYMPWGTLLVNVVGSVLIGLVMAIFDARGQLDSQLRMALTVGILGGFTTYSAFAFEVVTLMQRRMFGSVAVYLALTFALTFAGCYGGMLLVRGR